MKKKYYIFVLTFLCLLCGQLSYGFGSEGSDDDWDCGELDEVIINKGFCFECINELGEVIITTDADSDSHDPCDPFSNIYDYDVCFGNNDSGDPCDFNSYAFDECICNPASCD
jgi:hypothetical protein